MRRINFPSTSRLFSLLLSVTFLSAVAGMTASPVFAEEKKNISAEVEFNIVIVGDILSPFGKPRAIGRLTFSGMSRNGDLIDGVGVVYIVIDVIGAGFNLSVAPLVAAEVNMVKSNGTPMSGRVIGKLRDIEVADFDDTWVDGLGEVALEFLPE